MIGRLGLFISPVRFHWSQLKSIPIGIRIKPIRRTPGTRIKITRLAYGTCLAPETELNMKRKTNTIKDKTAIRMPA